MIGRSAAEESALARVIFREPLGTRCAAGGGGGGRRPRGDARGERLFAAAFFTSLLSRAAPLPPRPFFRAAALRRGHTRAEAAVQCGRLEFGWGGRRVVLKGLRLEGAGGCVERGMWMGV